MTRALGIFIILFALGCEDQSEIPSGGFIVDRDEFKEQFESLENEILAECPPKIDTAISKELLSDEVELINKVVYHPVIKMHTGNRKDPYIDRNQFYALVIIEKDGVEETWSFNFDKRSNLLSKSRVK